MADIDNLKRLFPSLYKMYAKAVVNRNEKEKKQTMERYKNATQSDVSKNSLDKKFEETFKNNRPSSPKISSKVSNEIKKRNENIIDNAFSNYINENINAQKSINNRAKEAISRANAESEQRKAPILIDSKIEYLNPKLGEISNSSEPKKNSIPAKKKIELKSIKGLKE